MKNVIIVGGGAAGMLAAITASDKGNKVTVIEKNEKLGKKVFITGKGRCNITNTCDMETFFQNMVSNEKFLYSAAYTFDSNGIISMLEESGCAVKVERGERAFPVSDHASDVIRALQDRMRKNNVEIMLNTKVSQITTKDGVVTGVVLGDKTKMLADAVIVTTGGMSYPTTGSDGDGFIFAKELGHKVIPLVPALVPLETREEWCPKLQGLALKNVRVLVEKDGKELFSGFGEMLFTHFGVSGPLILSASSYIAKKSKDFSGVIHLDLKPALTFEQLDKRVLREFEENKNKQFKNTINSLFPSKLIPVMLDMSGIHPDKKVNEISKEERQEFVKLIKDLVMHVTGNRGFREAIVTQGGVSVKEVNPSTMESKIVNGLYFAGEVLDLDALTGGFNLQIAWSTGYLAGSSIE